MVLMDKIVIAGGHRLRGTVRISGSKNAVLPIMACSLLADGDYTLRNVPILRDVRTMARLLQSIGVDVRFDEHILEISSRQCTNLEAPYDLVKTMRASIYVLGPLLSRFGHAKVSMPGGCAWGPRPVNLHISGLEKMGARIAIQGGYIVASANKKLNGAHITFDMPSVGATGNLLMAAVLAKGTTIIENAAREPEITALARFLVKMGAHIHGVGTETIEVEGVDRLQPAADNIIPDRIETGTLLVAGHITGGEIRLEGAYPAHLTAVIEKLKESGAHIEEGNDWIRVQSDGKIHPVDISTMVYPGFPTDMQAQWMALMSLAGGSSIIIDTVFHDRFTHVAELRRLGAQIKLDHNIAVIRGIDRLSGAQVMSTDLRASASLILAGLVAQGRTDISRVYHIDRGYERIELKMKSLGADIWREQEELVT
jgi:UDP-N-acetylglucosamine 1-carboxyvinyltransferase